MDYSFLVILFSLIPISFLICIGTVFVVVYRALKAIARLPDEIAALRKAIERQDTLRPG